MAVTENQLISREDGNLGGGPVNADTNLLVGTAAFVDAVTGGMTDIINAGANKLAGIVRDMADNTGGSLGDINVTLWERSSFILPLASAAQADVGKKLYASDNYTFTLSSTSTTLVGTITRVIDDANVLVAIDVQLP